MNIILFDFDFTLGDSSRGILECFRYALESHGLPVPDDEVILSSVGMSLPASFAVFGAPEGQIETLKKQFRERGDEIMVAWAFVYDETPELVSGLRSRGYKTGIVTSKFHHRIEAILARDGLSHLFDVIVGNEDVTRHKPEPDCIEMAVRLLGGDMESTTYIGDTVLDLRAARAAGARFIGVSTGPTPAEELSADGAPVVSRLNDLLAFFPPCHEERCNV